MKLEYKGKELNLDAPKIMGILNVTPDSFSDGGRYADHEAAVAHAREMVLAGASIIDVGGESTKPGAQSVSVQEELDRVIPVVETVAREMDVWISVDTSSPEVMAAALDAGARMINDVRALRREGAIEIVAERGCPVCIQHMPCLEPAQMQDCTEYSDLIGDISMFLYSRLHECMNAGISREHIIIDPGFGFGKTLDQNFRLLGQLDRFSSFALPILVGMSRKSMIGGLLNQPVNERLSGSIAAALYAVQKGASIVRVHDVKETADALRVYSYAEQFAKRKRK